MGGVGGDCEEKGGEYGQQLQGDDQLGGFFLCGGEFWSGCGVGFQLLEDIVIG